MTTYTVTQAFTKTPENIVLNIGDTLVKYSDSVLVKIGTVSITSVTFYSWIGSASSLSFMTAGATVPDDGGGGSSITPIDPYSDYKTSDIVAKINEIIAAG